MAGACALCGRFVIGLEQAALSADDAHVREEMPADAVDLRQLEQAAERLGEHVPQSLLEGLGIGRFGHLVLADDQAPGHHVLHAGGLELLARDIGQHQPVAIGHAQLAGIFAGGWLDQQRIALEHIHRGRHELARFEQRVHILDEPAVEFRLHQLRVEPDNAADFPILHFQRQQPPVRIQDQKIRPPPLNADRHVVPAEIIALEKGFEPAGKPLFAGSHASQTAIQAGD